MLAAGHARGQPVERLVWRRGRFGAISKRGMRQGWESYPLAQDAGYEPTLDPVQYQGRKALERHNAPNRDGMLRLGFVRKVRATAGSDPHLTFLYAVPSSGATHIEIRVFTGDKPRVFSIPVTSTKAWTEASVSLPAANPRRRDSRGLDNGHISGGSRRP